MVLRGYLIELGILFYKNRFLTSIPEHTNSLYKPQKEIATEIAKVVVKLNIFQVCNFKTANKIY